MWNYPVKPPPPKTKWWPPGAWRRGGVEESVSVADWALIAALLVLPVVRTVQSRRRRMAPGLCPACGYDLRGNPSATSCPECGAAVPAMMQGKP